MQRGKKVSLGLSGTLIGLVFQLALLTEEAAAVTGGAGVPGTNPPPPIASPLSGPGPSTSPSSGQISIVSARINTRKSFYYGVQEPRISFTIDSTQPDNDLRIDVVDSAGEIIRALYRNDVAPGAATAVRWDGSTLEGKPAHNGEYSFRIGSQATDPTARPRASASAEALRFSFYGYIFPIQGAHSYGDGIGGQRVGHTHQGQDLAAACGTPLLAVRGGTVQYSGYQAGGAGNFVVIDGKGTAQDTVYMHMLEPALLPEGSPVRTGQQIGSVGNTGDSQGCHLHFELWSAPGWAEGGRFMDPTPLLQRVDRYS